MSTSSLCFLATNSKQSATSSSCRHDFLATIDCALKLGSQKCSSFPELLSRGILSLVSLGTGVGGRALVVPQRGDGTDLIDFPGKALPSLRADRGWVGRRWRGRRRAGKGNWNFEMQKQTNK